MKENIKKVKAYMVAGIPALHEESSIREILAIFSDSHHNILPVVDTDGVLIGLISLEELLEDLIFSKEDISRLEKISLLKNFFTDIIENVHSISPLVLAKDIMETTVFSINEDEPMMKAAILMKKKGVHRLIVVNNKKVPTGYVSRNEVCKAFLI